MNVQRETAPVEGAGGDTGPLEVPPTPTVEAAPLPAADAIQEVESPSIKRRQSQVGPSSTSSSSLVTPLKRVKSEQGSVKVLPAKYELCKVEDIVVLIANMISELIQTNDSLPLRSGVLTRFHSR